MHLCVSAFPFFSSFPILFCFPISFYFTFLSFISLPFPFYLPNPSFILLYFILLFTLFSLFSLRTASLYSRSFALPTPPSPCPSSRFVLQLCQHSLSLSISFSGSLISCLPSNFTWPGVVRKDGQLPADTFHCPVITSKSNPLTQTSMVFFYGHYFYSQFYMHVFFYSWSACFSPPPFASSNERERERDSHKSHDPLLLFSPLLSLLLSFSSSSPFPLRILKLSIADSAPREARLRLQRLLHSAWATIPIWITFTTVGVEVPQCVFRDL